MIADRIHWARLRLSGARIPLRCIALRHRLSPRRDGWARCTRRGCSYAQQWVRE